MKTSRQSVILDIIGEQSIETQGQMLEALLARGVKSTQATVSRDIKELRLVKEIGPDGRYRYAQADQNEASESARRLEEIFREGCVGFDHALRGVRVHRRHGGGLHPGLRGGGRHRHHRDAQRRRRRAAVRPAAPGL